jgi:uncharacterized membrane protein
MKKSIVIYLNKLLKQLWFRPFLFCLVSVAGALIAHQADGTGLKDIVPAIEKASIEGLLNTISASMLVISTFAVASMLSAFSAASTTATPRSFNIVVTDDVSQNALSVFIGAFIFSIVATVALNNNYYGKAGLFILFLFTLIFFALVILIFLRWVDRISRLGRLEHTIKQIEKITIRSISEIIKHPFLKGVAVTGNMEGEISVHCDSIGYVTRINMDLLQEFAQENHLRIRLNCLPGTFVQPKLPLLFLSTKEELKMDDVRKKLNQAFEINQTREFEEDSRFGLIALSEIASRALSPGINDPGTALQIIDSHVKLFFLWDKDAEESEVCYDRIEVPKISIRELFDDAFRPIARDGAGNIEVMLRLQHAFTSLETIDHSDIKKESVKHSQDAFKRAEIAMEFKDDLETLKSEALFSKIKKKETANK